MTAEWLTAIASLATFIVIAASAVAAVVQLRHVRNSNQLVVFNDFRQQTESEPYRSALMFARTEFPQRCNDEAFRRELLSDDSPRWLMLRDLCNLLDETGALVKNRMVDRNLACDLLYVPVVRTWDGLEPLIASRRAMAGYKIWEDFEYLVLLCRRFRERHPEGTYPRGEPRVPLPNPWPEAEEIAAKQD